MKTRRAFPVFLCCTALAFSPIYAFGEEATIPEKDTTPETISEQTYVATPQESNNLTPNEALNLESEAALSTLSGSSPAKISSAAELRTAFSQAVDGSSIQLTANIDLRDTGVKLSQDGATLTLDLNGHALTYGGGDAVFRISGTASFTLEDSAGGGSVVANNSDGADIIVNKGKGRITVAGGALQSTGGGLVSREGGSAIVKSCSFACSGLAIELYDASLSIEEGALITQQSAGHAVMYYCKEGYSGTFAMTGGNIVGTKAISPIWAYVGNTSNIEFTGGSITTTQCPAILVIGPGRTTLSGALSLTSKNDDTCIIADYKYPGVVNVSDTSSGGSDLIIDGATITNNLGSIAVFNSSVGTVQESDVSHVTGRICNAGLIPEVTSVISGKTTDDSCTFTLSNAAAYTSETKWAVYENENDSQAHPTVVASLKNETLILSDTSGELKSGTYYVGATQPGRVESYKLAVTVEDSYVAIAGVPYSSLGDALAAALDGDTVTLTRDITYTGENIYFDGRADETSRNVTLDLNGKVFTTTESFNQTLFIEGGATLIIKDSSAEKTGKLLGENTDVISVGDYETAGQLILESGTLETLDPFSKALSVYGGSSVVMNGGALKGAGNTIQSMNGSFVLHGGTITGCSSKTTPYYVYVPVSISGDYEDDLASPASFVMTGGSITDTGTISALKAQAGSIVSISGGTIHSAGSSAIFSSGSGLITVSQADETIPTNITSAGNATDAWPSATILVWPNSANGATVLDVQGGSISNQSSDANKSALNITPAHPLLPNGDPLAEGTGLMSVNAAATIEGAILPASVPSITTATLPAATQGTAYSTTLTATADTSDVSTLAAADAGSVSLTWSIAEGTLPAGLSLSADGVLSGIPTEFGSFDVSVKATSATGSYIKTLSLEVTPISIDPVNPNNPNSPTASNASDLARTSKTTIAKTGDEIILPTVGLVSIVILAGGLVGTALLRLRKRS